jgi:competence protein ComEC
MKKPHGFMNPGGFDYESWLFRQNIQATGYVRHAGAKRLPDRAVTIHRFRQYLSDRIRQWLPESRFTGILNALAIGDRGAIDTSQWQVLRRTGTNHLVAISGLHVGIVSGLVYLLISWIWRR